jgi:hypothetical protein
MKHAYRVHSYTYAVLPPFLNTPSSLVKEVVLDKV